jgi:GNAT superfamily N-acetyltransferase
MNSPLRAGSEPNAKTSVASDRAAPPAIEWKPPQRPHRPRIAEIVESAGVFRPDEVDVALEVFDCYCDAPGKDYWAMGAYSEPDQLAGFAFYGPTPCTVDTWDLYWIVVGTGFQGRGVGRGLIEQAEQRMRSAGARMCVIETSSRDDYSATRRFYLSCGYREVARIADFYDVGDDRVTYAKQFE